MTHYPNVDPNPNFPELEKQILEYWKRERIFERSIDSRPAKLGNSKAVAEPAMSPQSGAPCESQQAFAGASKNNEFVFYDGPPFANGLPHYGHLLTGYVKDAIARYQTMRGKRVERRFGWDCHGLPAEMGSEKELGISGRAAITEFGIGKFNEHCRTSVMKYTNEWENYVNRQARWVDFKNDYKTMDKNFMESVLWAFKQLYEKELVYEAYRVMPYSWAAETPLSNFETKLDNSYREREDKAITVAFELNEAPKGAPKADKYFVLAWTTTPWTLPSNLALAVNKEIIYTWVIKEGHAYLCADNAAMKLFGDYIQPVKGEFSQSDLDEIASRHKLFGKGENLLGLTYNPLFPYFANHPNAFRILDGSSFVTDGDGTGIVHMAPGFGEDDQKCCEANGIEVVVPVDGQGKYTDAIKDIPWTENGDGEIQRPDNTLSLKGLNVIAETAAYDDGDIATHIKDRDVKGDSKKFQGYGLANMRITRWLKANGKLIKEDKIDHNYPHCWRTDQPLIYRAMPSWYVEVTKFRDRAVEINKQINWVPSHIRDGQMAHMLATAPDWSISRNRFWGTPIPVWRTKSGKVIVIGSIAELEQLSGKKVVDLHRPYIDEITIEKDGEIYTRVEDVFDCWFESGSMPFAQVHYPFENKEWFETHFPADFITEYVGQTRGWFNTLIMLSTALFDKPPFLNCICHGVVLDSETGLKYSKRLKNYKDPMEVMDKFGADALRWLMLASPVMRGHDLSVDPEGKFIRDVVRLAIKPIWNAYNFFTMYANADGVKANIISDVKDSKDPMDYYILAKCKQAINTIETSLNSYDTPTACDAVIQFFEALNNWYIRRTKERFWKTENDADKQYAYDTLYTVLTTLCRAAAPLLPLTFEEIYKGLTGEKSVHLAAFPVLAEDDFDTTIIAEMDFVRDICNSALAIRNKLNIRVRQPLRSLSLKVNDKKASEIDRWNDDGGTDILIYSSIIKDEINVKEFSFGFGYIGDIADIKLSINSAVLGKRLPEKMKQILPASKKGEWTQRTDGRVEICGEALESGEYTLNLEPKPEYKDRAQALSTNDALVILDTTVTPELEAEGLARDLVRMIQQARKDAGLHVADRIELSIAGDSALMNAAKTYETYISEQTLSQRIVNEIANNDWYKVEKSMDDLNVTIALKKVA